MENFGNKNLLFLSPDGVSPIGGEGRRGGFADIPPEKESERERERENVKRGRDRGAKKTKRRSAPHESLIESIHGDSGEKKNRPFRDTNGRSGGEQKCAGSLQRGGSRKRTLKSLILEEEETREREKGRKRRDGRRGKGREVKFVPRRIYAPISYTELSCKSPESVSRVVSVSLASVTRFFG